MITTLYLKTEFNLPNRQFFLYEPIVADIITRDGRELIRALDGAMLDYVKNNSTRLVREFKADTDNLLIKDFVSDKFMVEEWHGNTVHNNCVVIPHLIGGYMLTKCLDCGTERKLSINSGVAVSESEKISCKTLGY